MNFGLSPMLFGEASQTRKLFGLSPSINSGERHQGETQAPFQGDDGLETQPAGRAKLVGAHLRQIGEMGIAGDQCRVVLARGGVDDMPTQLSFL